MEQLINQKDTLLTTIKQRPPMFFAIVNNLLALNTKAINLGISPQAIVTTT
jgi:hypothetical protein